MAEACTLTFRLTESPKPAGQQLRAKWRCGAGVWAVSLEPALRALVLLGEDVTASAPFCARAAAAVRGRHSARVRLFDGAGFSAAAVAVGGGGGAPEAAEAAAEGSLPPPECCVLHVGVRRGGGAVRWESPLVAAQRAEAFVVAHPRGGWGGRRALVWRVDPVAAQAWVADAARAAAAAAAAPPPHYSVAATLRAYGSLADALVAQRARVAAGGEEWTRLEMLAKLSRLGTLRDRAIADATKEAARAKAAGLEEPPLPFELMAVLEAWETGNREVYGEEEREEVEEEAAGGGGGGGGGEAVEAIEEP
jgi:hypothetical protein